MAEMNQFMITHWCGVPHKFIRHEDGSPAVERFAEMKEAGLNLVECYDYGYETMCQVLAACEKLGLRVTIRDNRIFAALNDQLTYEERRAILEPVVRDYAGYPALLGYHIGDEPNSQAFRKLGEVFEILKTLDPAHESYVNLFPNYATPDMLGNPTYYDHLAQYAADVKPEIISYDHYSFCKEVRQEDAHTEGLDQRDAQILQAAYRIVDRPGFFDNIEDCRAVSVKSGIPFMVIVLVTEHGPYRDVTEAELRWEVFQSLCYGASRISYFTYWTPGVDREEGDSVMHWKGGLIAKDGSRTHHYDMVQKVNKDLQILGNILLNHRSEAVYHIGNEPDGKVTYWPGHHGDITSLEAAKLTVGCFDRGYTLLANKDYTNAQKVTFGVTEGKRVMAFCTKCGLWKPMTVDADGENGTYAVEIAAGDALLIRVD